MRQLLLEPGQGVSAPELTAPQLSELARAMNLNVTWRTVLKAGALTAGAAALSSAALAVGVGAGRKRGQKTGEREFCSFVFDLSWCDTADHDVVLVAHPYYHKLRCVSPGKLLQLRNKHPCWHVFRTAS